MSSGITARTLLVAQGEETAEKDKAITHPKACVYSSKLQGKHRVLETEGYPGQHPVHTEERVKWLHHYLCYLVDPTTSLPSSKVLGKNTRKKRVRQMKNPTKRGGSEDSGVQLYQRDSLRYNSICTQKPL